MIIKDQKIKKQVRCNEKLKIYVILIGCKYDIEDCAYVSVLARVSVMIDSNDSRNLF